jgi:putative membrane protein
VRTEVLKMKKIVSVLLTAVFFVLLSVPALSFDMPTTKEEVVYGILAADGSVQDLYVVNSFPGGAIVDYGDYSDVHNMSSSEALIWEGDLVTINTTVDRFYYQGTLKKKALPWQIAIQYELDGEKLPAADLAGRNGALKIQMDITQNKDVNAAFYDNYMLQITLALDTERCSEIKSPDGTIANAGKDKVIAHFVLPGNDKIISVTAQVRDFVMPGIEMTAMPFVMRIDMPDTEELTEDLNKLSDAIGELNDGVEELSSGVDETHSGARKLADGSAKFADGLEKLSNNSQNILSASAKIKTALRDVAQGLEQGLGTFSLEDLEKLPGALRELSGGLTGVAGGLTALETGYAQAYPALDGAISSIPDADVDEISLYGLYMAVAYDDTLTDTLDGLMGYYEAGQRVKGTYAAVKEAFAAVADNLKNLIEPINEMAGILTGMADEIEQSLDQMDVAAQLQRLTEGLFQLADNYGQFHTGLGKYVKGVKDLNGGYSDVNRGIRSLSKGIGELNTGASELYEGTSELHEEVSQLPDKVQEEIEKMIDQFDKSDFVPISFVSEKNTAVEMTQFVLKTMPIEKPETSTPTAEKPANLNLWQKVLDLLGLNSP